MTWLEAKQLEGKVVRVSFIHTTQITAGDYVLSLVQGIEGLWFCVAFPAENYPGISKPVIVEGILRTRYIPPEMSMGKRIPPIRNVDVTGSRVICPGQ
jgi:hypothetical protein